MMEKSVGVKSTVRLTREQAEQKFIELYIARNRNSFRALAVRLSDDELEDLLERWNDERAGGEGFENYLIGKLASNDD